LALGYDHLLHGNSLGFCVLGVLLTKNEEESKVLNKKNNEGEEME